MVTRNRARLARRAVHCFAAQTWSNRELVIIDDGAEDYEPTLAPFRDRCEIAYHRFPPDPARRLGAARNLSLEHAKGEFCVQWDDDEWYHPERIAVQMGSIERGFDGSVLRDTLMHLDSPEYVEHPFRTGLWRGTPGTILHRACDVRYPNVPLGEDTTYLRRLRRRLRIEMLRTSHLFIRCFHGANSWDLRHFTERLWYSPLAYLRARYVARDIFTHPAFKLNEREREATRRFLRESRELEVFAA
jgi:glycosyltransferase involved in cell wall biosynthesis